MSKPVCVIIGAGPGNGAAFARRFAQNGYATALLARNAEGLQELEDEIEASRAYACDATRQDDLGAVFARIEQELGPLDVLIYNASSREFADLEHTSAEAFERAWTVTTLGCFLAIKEVAPRMCDAGHGSIIIIGATASLTGNAGFVAFASAKAAQRSLAQSIARDLGPAGIHVAYVVIDAMIDSPRARQMVPDADDEFFARSDDIAETVFYLAHQPRSAWTFELDLRPFKERW
jgi:NAD(P)-dependent dehydrogenase (short-subunit alcohol dehydrogenase family)